MHSNYLTYEYAQGLKLYAYNPAHWKGPSAPILCIHGWLDNHGSFLPLTQHLPGLPWICIDLIGHGKSAWRSPSSFYNFQDYICDIALWIEKYCPHGVHLVGHSLGASIVSIVAGLYPDKVLSLVLLDGAGPLVSDLETMCEQFRRSILQFIKPHPLKLYPSLEALAVGRKKKHNITLQSCQILAQHGHILQSSGIYQWSFDPKLIGLSPFQMTDLEVLTILNHIKIPTLFIRPLDGYPYPDTLMQQRLRCFENLQYVCTPGGHHAHLDFPRASADFIKNFYHTINIL